MDEPVWPHVGQMVHYVSWGTPFREDGTQKYTSQCRAAVITESDLGMRVGLQVINPTGVIFNQDIDHDESCKPGTWHWLETCGS